MLLEILFVFVSQYNPVFIFKFLLYLIVAQLIKELTFKKNRRVGWIPPSTREHSKTRFTPEKKYKQL
jgi:hypothetical protein